MAAGTTAIRQRTTGPVSALPGNPTAKLTERTQRVTEQTSNLEKVRTAFEDAIARRDVDRAAILGAEARPYIHAVADSNGVVKPRFEYMTTLVTFTAKKAAEGGEVRLMPGGTPEVSLTDAGRERVVWVDTYHPEKWDETLKTELGPLWAGQ